MSVTHKNWVSMISNCQMADDQSCMSWIQPISIYRVKFGKKVLLLMRCCLCCCCGISSFFHVLDTNWWRQLGHARVNKQTSWCSSLSPFSCSNFFLPILKFEHLRSSANSVCPARWGHCQGTSFVHPHQIRSTRLVTERVEQCWVSCSAAAHVHKWWLMRYEVRVPVKSLICSNFQLITDEMELSERERVQLLDLKHSAPFGQIFGHILCCGQGCQGLWFVGV